MKSIIFGIVMAIMSTSSFAYKECPVKTSRLYIGDNGSLWMTFVGGGAASIRNSDVDFEMTYSLLLAAQMSDKTVTIRFQGDDALCNSGTRTDVAGVWLHK